MDSPLWHLKTQKLISKEKIIDTLLKNRNFTTKPEIDQFFNPSLTPFFNLKLKDISKVIKRINTAITNSEKIIIYSDYDADGICGTALLWETLYQAKTKVKPYEPDKDKVLPYVPDRMTEGYGLNIEAIKALKQEGAGLIITVDHGISAAAEIEFAKSLGIDVIVTDHHLLPDQLPQAYGIIHTTELSGCGVAAKLAYEFAKNNGFEDSVLDKFDLVAIATIADLVPLVNYNRSLVKIGLEKLNHTNRPGLLYLYSQAGIVPGKIGSWEVSHIIAPRINAAGRLENAISSLRLLCSRDNLQAKELAKQITQTNTKRQDLSQQAIIHAKSIYLDNTPIGVMTHPDWHEGIIGLIASKLVEQHYRPMIVISQKDGISKGSARSISGFNIVEAIRSCEDILESVGGHPMAAGFSIKTNKIEIFSQRIIEFAQNNLNNNSENTIDIDCLVEISDMDFELFNKIEKFAPFGVGNQKPLFLSKNVEVNNLYHVGADNKHLKLEFGNLTAIGFGMGERIAQIRPGDKIDLVYTLDNDEWTGPSSIQLKIKDFKTYSASN